MRASFVSPVPLWMALEFWGARTACMDRFGVLGSPIDALSCGRRDSEGVDFAI